MLPRPGTLEMSDQRAAAEGSRHYRTERVEGEVAVDDVRFASQRADSSRVAPQPRSQRITRIRSDGRVIARHSRRPESDGPHPEPPLRKRAVKIARVAIHSTGLIRERPKTK